MTVFDYKKLYSQKIRLILANNVILTLNFFPIKTSIKLKRKIKV